MQMLLSTLALASVALAAPTPESADTVTPPYAQEFGVAFSVRSGDQKNFLGAHLVLDTSYSESELILVGKDLVANPYSTPAYTNGTGSYTTALVFDLTKSTGGPNGIYGAFATELGEAYGNQSPVGAIKGNQEFKWTVNSTIDHERDAAPQQFFACNRTVNGEAVQVLSFGVSNENLGPPENCESTEVIQVYNVPGGLLNPAGP